MVTKSILLATALTGLFIASANAGPVLQGAKFNGLSSNGVVLQGPVLQGAKLNGTQASGLGGRIVAIEF